MTTAVLAANEPVGIVIRDGGDVHRTPRILMWFWASEEEANTRRSGGSASSRRRFTTHLGAWPCAGPFPFQKVGGSRERELEKSPDGEGGSGHQVPQASRADPPPTSDPRLA